VLLSNAICVLNALKRHYADLQLVAHVFSRPHSDTWLFHSTSCKCQVS